MCVICPLVVQHILAMCPIFPHALHSSVVKRHRAWEFGCSTCGLSSLWSVARGWCRPLYLVLLGWGTGRNPELVHLKLERDQESLWRLSYSLIVVSLVFGHLRYPKPCLSRSVASNVSPNSKFSHIVRYHLTGLPLQRIEFEALDGQGV
jgi:hypothetical protein